VAVIHSQLIRTIAKMELKYRVLKILLAKDILNFNQIDNKMQVSISNIYFRKYRFFFKKKILEKQFNLHDTLSLF